MLGDPLGIRLGIPWRYGNLSGCPSWRADPVRCWLRR